MVVRLLLGVIFLATLTGCATTGGVKTNQEQMQTRMTELEKKVEEKDSEIVDLQYQVKDLSSKVGGSAKDSADVSDETVSSKGSFSKAITKVSSDDINRVNADVSDIQKALKNAGNYTGKIDGKLGAGTKLAIVEFQKEHHLAADGVLGKKTWKLLKANLKE
ncbi:MAG: peptidoglycan-binding protein [Candidatus Omnitrophica bacterium]|nr:peptidoglycan-binding protein [Candidatus Omnitrophota bacterium]